MRTQVRAGATDLGDITGLAGPAFPTGRLDGGADAVDYFRFTLTEAKGVHFGLRQQETDADLFLESEDGTVIASMTTSGTANEELPRTLLAGTYFVRIEAQEAGASTYVFRYGVTAADPEAVRELERQQQEENAGQVPAFGQQDYVLALAENADGSTNRVSLGTVSATDPEGAALAYSVVGGNEAGLFGIDAATGELFYTGSGEDYESGTTPFALTVRASDGTLFTDMAVTVNVTDLPEQAIVEAPVAQTPHQAGATDLGDITGLAGPAFPTGTLDGDADAVDYFRFTLSEAKGVHFGLRQQETNADLFLEDEDGVVIASMTTDGTTNEELWQTLLAGTYFVRIEAQEVGASTYVFRYGVNAADPDEVARLEAELVEAALMENDIAAALSTSGVVAVGGSATGEIEISGDRDWLAVVLTAGTHYRIDLEGSGTGDGTLGDPSLYGIYDSNGQLLSGTTNDDDGGVDTGRNSRVYFEATTDGTYYVAAGAHSSGTGTYTLSVTEVAIDDFAATPSTSGVVTVGSSATGEIETPGDQDWFAVVLSAGTRYRIDLEGTHTGEGTLWDAYLHGIYDSSGELVSGTSDDDSGAGFNSRGISMRQRTTPTMSRLAPTAIARVLTHSRWWKTRYRDASRPLRLALDPN